MIPRAVRKIEGHLILCDGTEYWCRTLVVHKCKTLADCTHDCREVLEFQRRHQAGLKAVRQHERSLAHAAL